MSARTPRRGGAGGEESLRQLAQQISSMQAELLGQLHREMGEEGGDAFAAAAQELARAFGSVSATAVGTLAAFRESQAQSQPVPGRSELKAVPGEAEPEPVPGGAEPEPVPGLHRQGHMRRRLDQLVEMHRRYEHPFGLLVIDVRGPDARGGDPEGGRETILAVVDAALRDSIRLVDEAYRLEENGLCVLAPNQTTVGGVQMAERVLGMLDELEAAGGLRINISAGVVACPEHGTDAERLLRQADEAMWRAQAVGQPVGVGPLRAVQDQ